MYKDSNDRLNELVQYIEKHLTEKIEYDKLARILAVNEYTLCRIFLFITNMSLTEYIRKRRLSMAAMELINSNSKVIDVAVKYGYDSGISFSRAFKKMMGFNPKDIKKNQDFIKLFPVLSFNDVSDSTIEFEYKEVNNLSLELYGISTNEIKVFEIPKYANKLWKETIDKYGDSINFDYGVVEYDNLSQNQNGSAKYYVATKEKIKNGKKIEILNKDYLVFKLKSINADEISEFTKKIYKNFISEFGYNVDRSPDIEEYIDETTYIHIPIIKTKK